MSNIKYWQHQVLAQVESDCSSHALQVGIQNGLATLQNSLAASFKDKPYTHFVTQHPQTWVFLLEK